MREFSTTAALIADARAVLDELNRNHDNGNQYLLVLSLHITVREELDANKSALVVSPFASCLTDPRPCLKSFPRLHTTPGHAD